MPQSSTTGQQNGNAPSPWLCQELATLKASAAAFPEAAGQDLVGFLDRSLERRRADGVKGATTRPEEPSISRPTSRPIKLEGVQPT